MDTVCVSTLVPEIFQFIEKDEQIMNQDTGSRIKVLHMITIDESVYKLLLDKMNCLREYGYDITFMSSPGKYTEDVRNAGYRFEPVEIARTIRPIKDITALIKAYRFIKKEKFTIVHTHTAKAGFIGRLAARLAGVPLVIHTSHGLPFYKGLGWLKSIMYFILEKLACRISDYIFSQNMDGIDAMLKYKIKAKYGMGYEGNGINTAKLDQIYENLNADQKRNDLGIESGRMVVGYYARLEPVKGHRMFLEAFKNVVVNHPDVLCLIAGKGNLEEDIRKFISVNNLHNNVRLLGYREDIHEIIAITDIVVLTSEKEGIPRILMESMYMKKPVAATNVTGTNELVIHGETGLLAEYGNVEALEICLSILIEDSKLMTVMGNAGRQRVKHYFTEEAVAERIHREYRKLLVRKGISSTGY